MLRSPLFDGFVAPERDLISDLLYILRRKHHSMLVFVLVLSVPFECCTCNRFVPLCFIDAPLPHQIKRWTVRWKFLSCALSPLNPNGAGQFFHLNHCLGWDALSFFAFVVLNGLSQLSVSAFVAWTLQAQPITPF